MTALTPAQRQKKYRKGLKNNNLVELRKFITKATYSQLSEALKNGRSLDNIILSGINKAEKQTVIRDVIRDANIGIVAHINPKKDVVESRVIELGHKGLSQREIVEKLANEGIKIGRNKIANYLKTS
jgi:DNA-directed RNA polymerase specialized sigma54-like protein